MAMLGNLLWKVLQEEGVASILLLAIISQVDAGERLNILNPFNQGVEALKAILVILAVRPFSKAGLEQVCNNVLKPLPGLLS